MDDSQANSFVARREFRALVIACWFYVPAALTYGVGTVDIVDTDGFETGFNLGALQGQSGWVTAGGGVGTATVQSSVVEAGTKGVRVDRGANSDDRWAVPVGGMGFPNNRYILVDWDMNVTGTGASSVFGPFLGVDTYDDTISPKLLGSMGVDATTSDVLYQATGSGVLANTGATVTFGQWHHYQIRLDFLDDEYTVLLDSVPLVTTGFVDGATDVFTDADIGAFAAAFDGGSQSQTATAYFDNFLVRDVARADFDIDGDVDDVDLADWEDAFGPSDGADADLDGDSDGFDFLIWQSDHEAGAGPLLAGSSTVPEPSSLALALLAFWWCRSWSRGRA